MFARVARAQGKSGRNPIGNDGVQMDHRLLPLGPPCRAGSAMVAPAILLSRAHWMVLTIRTRGRIISGSKLGESLKYSDTG